MTKYSIITDSTTDLSPEIIKDLEIDVLPLRFTIDEKTYCDYPDGRELSSREFYDLISQGKESTTAQINVAEFVESFESKLKQGKDVLYIAFSSGLSGTYNSAVIAAKELMEKYPDRKIRVVDSLCASMGEGLFVYYAVNKSREGLSIDELADWLENNKLKFCHWFTVNDLFHLKRGGRVSATAAVVGTMLSIKPVLHVDDEGHLIPVKKVRGRKQSLEALVEQMEIRGIDNKENTVFISHGDCQEDAKFVSDLIKEKFGTKDIRINSIGPVIGTHAGPGTVALFFIGKER